MRIAFWPRGRERTEEPGAPMKRSQRQKVMIAIAVAAVIAGVVVAIASSGGGSSKPAPASVATAQSASRGDLAAAASYLGVSRAQLRRDLRGGKTLAEVADTTGGRSTAGLIETLANAKAARSAGTSSGRPAAVEAARRAALRKRASAEVKRLRGTATDAAAPSRYLGMAPQQILAELRSGRSLAQIAGSTSGRSAAGLIEAMVSARTATIAAGVASGRLTPADQAVLLATLRKRVTAAVYRTFPMPASRRG